MDVVVLAMSTDSRFVHKIWQERAIFQKYEHREARFYDIIAERIIVEEIMQGSLW